MGDLHSALSAFPMGNNGPTIGSTWFHKADSMPVGLDRAAAGANSVGTLGAHGRSSIAMSSADLVAAMGPGPGGA